MKYLIQGLSLVSVNTTCPLSSVCLFFLFSSAWLWPYSPNMVLLALIFDCFPDVAAKVIDVSFSTYLHSAFLLRLFLNLAVWFVCLFFDQKCFS